MEIDALVYHVLDRYHARAWKRIPVLQRQLATAPPGLRSAFDELVRVFAMHMHKEERILFPSILAITRGKAPLVPTLAAPIAAMQADHDHLEELVQRVVARLGEAGPASADLAEFLVELGEHAAVEDDQLFPAALELRPSPV